MEKESKKIVFFGAGASYGSDTESEIGELPPLGKDLYSKLNEEKSLHYWKEIHGEADRRFRVNFEEGMTFLVEESYARIANLQEELAAYFSRFLPQKDNLYIEFAERIATNEWNGSLITLNYDRLLDEALISNRILPVAKGASSYFFTHLTKIDIPDEYSESAFTIDFSKEFRKKIEVCYPHGACHFLVGFPNVKKANTSTISPIIMENREVFHFMDSRILIPILNYNGNPFYWFPVICKYEPSKNPTSDSNFIKIQKDRFTELICDAEKITIIGVEYVFHDYHIWDAIKKTNASIFYINPSKNTKENMLKDDLLYIMEKKKRLIFIEKNFKDSFKDVCEINDLV